jgi:hypothetical protein
MAGFGGDGTGMTPPQQKVAAIAAALIFILHFIIPTLWR